MFEIREWPYEVSENDIVVNLTFNREPESKARPRFSPTGHAYTPAKTRVYEQELGYRMKAVRTIPDVDAASKYGLRCLFYRSNRQRIDCDNLLKAVSDAANGVIWADDSQVSEVIGRLFLAEDKPRVEILIYRLENTSPPHGCPICGNPVTTYPSTQVIYCSQSCFRESRKQDCVCAQCGKTYRLAVSLAKKRRGFCSRECSIEYHKPKLIDGRKPYPWKCTVCGGEVSRKEYKICRSCSMKARGDPSSNYWKLRHRTEDALNNIAWADDKQIARLVVNRKSDTKNPRLEVSITEISGAAIVE